MNGDGEIDDLDNPPLPDWFTTRRAIAAILVLLMWVKTFYWMRLFSATSFYIRLIQETLTDIVSFMILFVFILMTFGNTLLVMN